MKNRECHTSLRDLLIALREEVLRKDASEGYCVCGDPIDSHSIGSGHSPVDAGDYHVWCLVEEIDKVLEGLK